MSWKRITKRVMIWSFIALLIYDGFVALTPEEGDTISELIRAWSHKHLVIPFGFGFLMGHWFFGKE